MADFYADTSVLVKRHIREIGSDWVVELTELTSQVGISTSHLARIEVVSALNRRVRERQLTTDAYITAINDFETMCRDRYTIVRFDDSVIIRARTLLESHPLRAYDALHLASALLANAALLTAGFPALIFLAADVRLLDATRAEGLVVDNPNDH
jgi:predicted nucleic acid-binding protein